MKCQKCQEETILPFQCPYCGKQFCSNHRLPENHECSNLALAQTERQTVVGEGFAHKTRGYQYSFSFGTPIRQRNRVAFSSKELKHISVAALLVVGIGFSIGLYVFGSVWSFELMALFAAAMTSSFLVHEIAHKIMAQRHGLWAEFRLTTWGAVITFASVFLPFKFISPGAMMIAGSPDKEGIVKISVAGPITNIAFSLVFLCVYFVLPPLDFGLSLLFLFAGYINAFMATFNLIPFGILDGYKIFSFNKRMWALAFTISVVLAVVSFLQLGKFGF
jgi:Zn-dependent protease